jgi:ATP-dependent protease HslVU (ClpYQ) ATPase subunit
MAKPVHHVPEVFGRMPIIIEVSLIPQMKVFNKIIQYDVRANIPGQILQFMQWFYCNLLDFIR